MSTGTPWNIKANRIRKAKKITYEAIADRLGVHKSTVGHWFTGHTRAPFHRIKDVAMCLDVNHLELLEDDPYYVTNDVDRAIMDCVREIPEKYKKQALETLKAYATNIPADAEDNTPT